MVKYVYICSAGHSGSTLLDFLIGSHSRVASLGEISNLPKSIAANTLCTCGSPVRACATWQEVIEKISDSLGVDIWKNPDALALFPQEAAEGARKKPFSQYTGKLTLALWYAQLRFGLGFLNNLLISSYNSLENNFILYDAVRAVLNADVIVDSSKHYLKAVGLYKKNPDEVRIILLTRDGRGVLYSNIKKNLPQKKCVSGWKRHYARALHLFADHVAENHIYRLKYEDLVMHPKNELQGICNFLSLEFEATMLNFASKKHHTTNGNRMRFGKSDEIKPDVEWQRKLSEADRLYFETKAGKLNRKIGYE